MKTERTFVLNVGNNNDGIYSLGIVDLFESATKYIQKEKLCPGLSILIEFIYKRCELPDHSKGSSFNAR